MSHTAHTDPEMMKERFDEPAELEKKIDQLVAWIKEAKHFTICTGAGVSTSAGIPDFRGPQGVWTLKAQGKERSGPTVSTTKAIPTLSHMSIVELTKRNILTYLISTNCDGLHKRSGMPPDRISELHGNSNIEECETCGKQYLRDFAAHRLGRGSDHYTGRHCVVADKTGKVCNGRLLEWTIDFGQNLPEVPLKRAFAHSKKADLCLVLGSSCLVTPAADCPKMVGQKKGARLVVCNLQKTPLYNIAKMNIHARCDTVMAGIMQRLGIDIPRFVLRRKINITHRWQMKDVVDAKAASASASASSSGSKGAAPVVTSVPTGVQLSVTAVDVGEPTLPATVIRFATITDAAAPKGDVELIRDPFIVELKPKAMPAAAKINLQWFGHYNEPALPLVYPLTPPEAVKAAGSGGAAASASSAVLGYTNQYLLEFRYFTGEWTVTQVSGHPDAQWIHADSKQRIEAELKAEAAAKAADSKSGGASASASSSSSAAAGTAAAGTEPAKRASTTLKVGSGGAAEAAAAAGAPDPFAALTKAFEDKARVAGNVASGKAVSDKPVLTLTARIDVAAEVAKAGAPAKGGAATAASSSSAGSGGAGIDVKLPANSAAGSGKAVATAGGLAAAGYWGTTTVATDMKDKRVIVCAGGVGNSLTAEHNGFISVFDLESKQWRDLPVPQRLSAATVQQSVKDKQPLAPRPPYLVSARWGHTATVVPEVSPSTVYFVAGWDSTSQFNDVHAYDVKSHTLTAVQHANASEDEVLTHRAHHSAVADGKSIVVFGGSICRGGPYHYFNDLYRFNLTDKKWTRVDTTGERPSPRAQHSAVLTPDGQFMIVTGGCNGTEMFADVYVLQLDGMVWHRAAYGPASEQPPANTKGLTETNYRVHPARHTALMLPAQVDGLYRVLISGLSMSAQTWLMTVKPKPKHYVNGPAFTVEWKKVGAETPLPVGCTIAATDAAEFVAFGGSRSREDNAVASALLFGKVA